MTTMNACRVFSIKLEYVARLQYAFNHVGSFV